MNKEQIEKIQTAVEHMKKAFQPLNDLFENIVHEFEEPEQETEFCLICGKDEHMCNCPTCSPEQEQNALEKAIAERDLINHKRKNFRALDALHYKFIGNINELETALQQERERAEKNKYLSLEQLSAIQKLKHDSAAYKAIIDDLQKQLQDIKNNYEVGEYSEYKDGYYRATHDAIIILDALKKQHGVDE